MDSMEIGERAAVDMLKHILLALLFEVSINVETSCCLNKKAQAKARA